MSSSSLPSYHSLDCRPVFARDNGQWAAFPAAIRQWFQSLIQPDNPAVSCCGEADAFEGGRFEVEGDHYVAIISDGKGVIASGTRIRAPNNKMRWGAGSPTGHGVTFIGAQGQAYCYIAAGGSVRSGGAASAGAVGCAG
jgi:hypothetical protein